MKFYPSDEEAIMIIKTVEFICDDNLAVAGTSASPRPADRPRPSAADVKRNRASVQSFDGAAVLPKGAEAPKKQDITT